MVMSYRSAQRENEEGLSGYSAWIVVQYHLQTYLTVIVEKRLNML